MPRQKYTFAQQTCIGKTGIALQRVNALWPGCRVGIAVSGGVDSLTLIKVMKIRQAITPFKFEIMALHCNPGFNVHNHEPLIPWLAEEGIAAHVEITDYGPFAHSEGNNKKSPCFLCAWNRRKWLFSLCRQYKLTHLALGHNADDLLSTFLLNFCRNGKVYGMNICETFFNGQLRLIRPLLLVEKKFISQAARQWRLPIWENDCPSSGKTARGQTEEIVRLINNYTPHAKRSMLNALIRWQLEKETATDESAVYQNVL